MTITPTHLRTVRRTHGWTQADLAAELGVSRQAVKSWEQGRRAPAHRHEARLLELATPPPVPSCTRPSYADLTPGDWAAASRYGWAEPKYDGEYAELRGGPTGWTVTSRTGRPVASGSAPLPRCHLLCEHIVGTEWARESGLYGSLVAWAALSSRGVHLSPAARDRLVAELQLAGLDVVPSQRIEIPDAPAAWIAMVERGGWEGLVCRTNGGRFGRMKRRVTVDYVCTGHDGDSVIGALYNSRGKLADKVRVPCPDPPRVGQVFEASGLARTARGSLRNPRWERWRNDKPATDCR